MREAVNRAGIESKDVGHVVFGNVIHTDVHDHYLSRIACVKGGLPHETPALTLNRLCGSGLQAIITAAQAIMLGDADCAVGGGAENMSRSPYLAPAMRRGARMNDTSMVDVMVGALSDPFDDVHMAITAENVAKKWNISREDQDALAAESHRRAGIALDKGYFKAQILPIDVKVKREVLPFEVDETVRRDSTVEKLAKLKPVFDPAGSVTAGNASSINDAAAAVVLMERGLAEKRGLHPIGRLVDYAYAGVDPKYMGIGPVPAVQNLLKKDRPEFERHRRVRSERGLRGPGAGRVPQLGVADGTHQSQRQRNFARPPHRRHRLHSHRQGAVRIEAHRRSPRTGYHVHRRWPRHRCYFRTHVKPRNPPTPTTGAVRLARLLKCSFLTGRSSNGTSDWQNGTGYRGLARNWPGDRRGTGARRRAGRHQLSKQRGQGERNARRNRQAGLQRHAGSRRISPIPKKPGRWSSTWPTNLATSTSW